MDDDIAVLRGERELFERAGHLFAAVRSELVCAASDHTTWAQPGASWAERTPGVRRQVGSGVAVRKLFTPSALVDADHARHLVEVVGAGAQVRVAPTALAHETIVLDRRVAILAGAPVDGVRRYTVVRAPEVVAGVLSLFEVTWAASPGLAEHRRRSPVALDDTGTAVLRLMSTGLTDDAAARRLGLSVRTYRRRVAEVMALLGAGSRFQAGARARELGVRP